MSSCRGWIGLLCVHFFLPPSLYLCTGNRGASNGQEHPVSSAALFPGITTITEQEKTRRRQSRCAPFDYTGPRSDYILYTATVRTFYEFARRVNFPMKDAGCREEREEGRVVPPVHWVTTGVFYRLFAR